MAPLAPPPGSASVQWYEWAERDLVKQKQNKLLILYTFHLQSLNTLGNRSQVDIVHQVGMWRASLSICVMDM